MRPQKKNRNKGPRLCRLFRAKIVNVVLLGFDVDTERRRLSLGSRTDTIKVISVNFDRDQVSIIDVPRDSSLKLPTLPPTTKLTVPITMVISTPRTSCAMITAWNMP